MEYNLNEKDIEQGKENLINIEDFKSNFPSLYTLSVSDGRVITYIDSSKEEYLIGMNLNGNIALFNDIDESLLLGFEEDAGVELHKTRLEVSHIIDNINGKK